MPSSEPSPQDSAPTDATSESETFAQELLEVERSLQDLKARYSQVQHDEQRQADLHQTRDRLQHRLSQTTHTDLRSNLKAELQQIEARLEELEFSLESRLFTWGSLREVFWQILRFGGLGMSIGWLLAFTTLQTPKPTPSLAPQTWQSPQP
jgi:small-conductance mechanosensitive channel